MKKVLIAVLLLLCLVCIAQAEGTTWKIDGTTLVISGQGAMPDYTEENLPPWHEERFTIEAIRVEEGVTAIGDYAFYEMFCATDLQLPSTVTSVGDNSFRICGALTSLNLPQGVTDIGEGAFAQCYRLTGMVIPAGGDASLLRTVDLSGCTMLWGVEDESGTAQQSDLPDGLYLLKK